MQCKDSIRWCKLTRECALKFSLIYDNAQADHNHEYPFIPPKLDDPEYNAQVLTSWRAKIQEAREQYSKLDISGAERTLQLALEEAGHFGQASGPVATSLLNLAQLYRRSGRLAEAEPLLVKAIDVLDQTAGPNNKVTLLALVDLAGTRFERGDAEGALSGYRDVLGRIEIAESTQKHARQPLASVRAGCLFSMARADVALDDYATAETRLLQVLTILEERWGATSARLLAPYAELARVVSQQGRAAEGSEWLAKARALPELKPKQRESLGKLAEELKL